jgi:hypothetical protein
MTRRTGEAQWRNRQEEAASLPFGPVSDANLAVCNFVSASQWIRIPNDERRV